MDKLQKCDDGEGFISNGKCIPYRNDRQKEGYKDAEPKMNTKVLNKYILEKKPTLSLKKVIIPKKGTLTFQKKKPITIPTNKNRDLIA